MLNPFSIDASTGLLREAEFNLSPNCDQRPSDTTIDLLVVHNISLPPGVFEGDAIKQLFLNELDYSAHDFYQQLVALRVSSHLLIRRNGYMIQFVPFHLRAWHAGVSSFEGRSQCNNFSIGIELEGTDHIPYTDIQYQHLSKVTSLLMQLYPAISYERIVGHQTIAPERKTDPGASFDWGNYFNLLKGS